MVSILNNYVSEIKLSADVLTQGILKTALNEHDEIENSSVMIKSNRFIVDVHLYKFSVEAAAKLANAFMEETGYYYSSFYVRFNEGNRVRYRYASCKENKEGFYCDIVIS